SRRDDLHGNVCSCKRRIEDQRSDFGREKRSRISELDGPFAFPVFGHPPDVIEEIIDRFGELGTHAWTLAVRHCAWLGTAGRTRAGIQDRSDRAPSTFMFSPVRKSHVPIRREVVAEQARADAPLYF